MSQTFLEWLQEMIDELEDGPPPVYHEPVTFTVDNTTTVREAMEIGRVLQQAQDLTLAAGDES